MQRWSFVMSLSLFARKTVICWCLAAASPAVVFGQPSFSPQGGEYPIAGALPGDQTYPCAAINANGGYLVWQDNAVTTNGLRIRAESLNGNLIGANAPFAVSAVAMAKTTGDQEKPQVALLQGGGAVIVWQGGKSGFQQVFARFLGAAAGSFTTKDLRISTHTRNNQIDPHVATLANGSVVVVWSSFGQDGSLQGIFARLFSAAGKPLGNEFQVNQFSQNNQRNPAVAALTDGNFGGLDFRVAAQQLQRGCVRPHFQQFRLPRRR